MTLLVIVCSCKKDDSVNPTDIGLIIENKDWYILTAPDSREIIAAYGDIDASLVITDGKNIYKTTDKGKTWQDGGYDSNSGLFGFAAKNDTLSALNVLSKYSDHGDDLFATNPFYYSLDQGSSWSPYPPSYRDEQTAVVTNRVKSASGIEYLVNREESGGYIENKSIKNSLGAIITLPSRHQINSLFLDSKSRIYISASAALCGSGSEFSYCGTQNGILYISKNAQP
ncbi:hypothetical protein [Dyadobacter sp. NIV53]|uniref:hypothetical protein n=1 Tax=Dyadobacter sp. NIV53 TaxID=2861765 RepID=UPI001C8783AD|nr:hypothetical protein [Dyadobacter sp. NIV53]